MPSVGDQPASAQPEGSGWVSAHTGAGLAELIQSIGLALGRTDPVRIELEPRQGRLHAWLHEIDAVLEENNSESGGWSLLVQLDEHGLRRLDEENVAVIGLAEVTNSAPANLKLTDQTPDQLAGDERAS